MCIHDLLYIDIKSRRDGRDNEMQNLNVGTRITNKFGANPRIGKVCEKEK